MKKFVVLFLMMILLISFSIAFAQDNLDKEKSSIKKVVTEAYVNGLLNGGDLEPTKKGFHPDFNLLGQRDNQLTKWPIAEWIKYAEEQKKKNPNGPKEKFTPEFPVIDITGSAAIVKIELRRSGKHKYTDYLSLYKFNDGWKIVSKIYCDHDQLKK